MIGSYLNQDGYRVQVNNWELYDDIAAASLTLTGNTPTVTYRLRVTTSSVTGHTNCAGTLTVNGSESLTFTQAATKVTTTHLAADVLPTVTTSGLDCNVLIEVLDVGGAILREETAKEIKCRFQDTQKSFRDAQGNWSLSSAIAYVNEPELVIGTKLSYDGYDYDIAQVSIMTGLGGSEMGRKLWLTGKTESPDRAIEVEEGAETLTRYMTKAVYDTDEDGIADKAEGVPVLSEIPTDLSEYSDGDMFKVGSRLYVVDKSE